MLQFIHHLSAMQAVILMLAFLAWFIGYIYSLYKYTLLLNCNSLPYNATNIILAFMLSLFSWLSAWVILPIVKKSMK